MITIILLFSFSLLEAKMLPLIVIQSEPSVRACNRVPESSQKRQKKRVGTLEMKEILFGKLVSFFSGLVVKEAN